LALPWFTHSSKSCSVISATLGRRRDLIQKKQSRHPYGISYNPAQPVRQTRNPTRNRNTNNCPWHHPKQGSPKPKSLRSEIFGPVQLKLGQINSELSLKLFKEFNGVVTFHPEIKGETSCQRKLLSFYQPEFLYKRESSFFVGTRIHAPCTFASNSTNFCFRSA
jgi:hypothetical protein